EFIDRHQARRFRVRQRAKDYCIDQTENRAVGPNGQRQRKNSHECEARMLPQHPQAITQVLPKPTEHVGPPVRSPNYELVRQRSPSLAQFPAEAPRFNSTLSARLESLRRLSRRGCEADSAELYSGRGSAVSCPAFTTI